MARPGWTGDQVREAMERRRDHHLDHGDAARQPDGRIAYRRNLIAALRDRDVARAGEELATRKALPFRMATDGETVTGAFTGTTQLASGKFAIVEKSHEFTLVPWRPVIDRQLGREVIGSCKAVRSHGRWAGKEDWQCDASFAGTMLRVGQMTTGSTRRAPPFCQPWHPKARRAGFYVASRQGGYSLIGLT